MTCVPDRLLQQAGRLQTLNEISRAVSATLDLHTLYDTIYQQVGRVMDTTLFFIALLGADGRAIELPYSREDGDLILDQTGPRGNSVTRLVIESGEALLFNTDREYQRYAFEYGLRALSVGDMEKDESASHIFMPLNTGSRTIGALTVQSRREYAYTPDDLHTLSVIAAQAAVAIENARLYQQSQHSVRQMQALLHVAQTINSSLNLPTVLDAILTSMREVAPYYLAGILLPDHQTRRLEVVHRIGPEVDEQFQKASIPFGEGVTGRAFQTGEPLIVSDVSRFPGYVSRGVRGVQSELALPLKRGQTVIGVLNVERVEFDAFSQQDIDLLSLFASQAAIAIENARLFTEQQRRVVELQTVQTIVQQLTPLHDIPAIATLINHELKALIDYHSCRVFALDEGKDRLVAVAIDEEFVHGVFGPRVGEGITGWIALHGESVLIGNLLGDPRASWIPGTEEIEESMIGAPLVYQDQVRGVITLTKLGVNQFDENDLRLLEIIAAQAAIAFDRARLYDELRTEAVTDALTTLYNRRYLGERFKEERSRALRNGHTLVALMLDIDQFKRVNDRYGHDAGDVVLQELARVTRAVVRAEDIVVRYGGEEFCVLLPEIPLEDAEQVAERLRAMIADHTMPAAAGAPQVTVSVGMAVLGSEERDGELFNRADQAMYRVKREGGNQVCIAEGEDFRFIETIAQNERL